MIERVSPRLRATSRVFNRGRWVRKARVARAGDAQVSFGTRLRFVLFDAETDTYSYEVESAWTLAEAVADVLGAEPLDVHCYVEELLSDQELARIVRSRTMWRPQYKWRPPLGRHIVAYCAIRTLRPDQTVELGVRHGLGTLVMLRALELNEQQGSPGFLLSVDCDPSAAGLVRPQPNWRFAVGFTPEVLTSQLLDRPIGFAVSDTTPDPVVTRGEFDFVLAHRARQLLLMQNGAWNDVLSQRAAASGWRFQEVVERSRNHVVSGRIIHLASSGVVSSAN